MEILRWFKENSMKANPKKIQFMILGKTPRQSVVLNINQIKVKESKKVVLMGLAVDNRLNLRIMFLCYILLLIINFMH